jgi:acyl carrier protein
MAVLTVITMLEERFGIVIHDDEIDGAAFATVGSLVDWVSAQVDPS